MYPSPLHTHTQVFGGLLMLQPEEGREETDSGAPAEGEKEDEVREHVVDILFSKNKLSSLQKQVGNNERQLFCFFFVFHTCTLRIS